MPISKLLLAVVPALALLPATVRTTRGPAPLRTATLETVVEPPEEPRNKLAPLAAAEWGLQLNSGMGGGAAVALARSLKWPGAVAAVVPKEDKCANLYVGYGLPLLDAPFAPAAPPPMSDDADELKEQADTPLADENVAHKAALEEELKNAPEEEEAPAAE